ncbi:MULTISPECIES: 50S ribosomal protein L4 [Nitrosomonas]|uniref:Large ribosomal subunit protein uL4 n=1 Tax=Nitrosomonas europaea (strain ATCC 19718 / CIP 103999 / KCTC 2705 / NBRC 14298) TaxID=228410 RepID=RL4_NITEU|nr:MULTISPECIES: 50S ribosomal protein L4 [Nitrosomonas]Q82X87.1 RecName: Full=Large ribosomal subunit protein uL4; AltName: Full=50S ribosomal protein L4 [Nitrosomonas europaea ATCC 19718]KXK39772.1 MAG: 50S ribosomal protein L4 [Nitrosomonas europaea]MBV6390673.1 50S ribosomal protein L4 [Nitrosomonas europaea]CAD84313.1 Ribosomal protein L4/L1e [Nitrosomonas europaea ATCC 19718]SDW64066.1 LSU ribosomal protein L4P [Nitrosomonas europaea]SET22123.1 LSU ribosomal protein L4P [Nitrosomonas eu
MVKIPCIYENGQIEDIEASESVFGRVYNEALVHQVVKSYLANARAGTRAQKGRSDVTGSTRKQWRQKGTGRARTGAATNPLWRGGGKIFPNKPTENFKQKLNRKMYRAGMCTIFSELLRNNKLVAIDEFQIEMPKTKVCLQKLKNYQLENVMIITSEIDSNLYLASRNLPNLKVVEVDLIDPVSLLAYDNVVITRDTVNKIENVLQ